MNFIMGLPKTMKGYIVIWVILTKPAHFILRRSTYTTSKWVQLYLTKIVRLHRASALIVRDACFYSKFWKELHSTTFHPQTNGQTKRLNQILEDML